MGSCASVPQHSESVVSTTTRSWCPETSISWDYTHPSFSSRRVHTVALPEIKPQLSDPGTPLSVVAGTAPFTSEITASPNSGCSGCGNDSHADAAVSESSFQSLAGDGDAPSEPMRPPSPHIEEPLQHLNTSDTTFPSEPDGFSHHDWGTTSVSTQEHICLGGEGGMRSLFVSHLSVREDCAPADEANNASSSRFVDHLRQLSLRNRSSFLHPSNSSTAFQMGSGGTPDNQNSSRVPRLWAMSRRLPKPPGSGQLSEGVNSSASALVHAEQLAFPPVADVPKFTSVVAQDSPFEINLSSSRSPQSARRPQSLVERRLHQVEDITCQPHTSRAMAALARLSNGVHLHRGVTQDEHGILKSVIVLEPRLWGESVGGPLLESPPRSRAQSLQEDNLGFPQVSLMGVRESRKRSYEFRRSSSIRYGLAATSSQVSPLVSGIDFGLHCATPPPLNPIDAPPFVLAAADQHLATSRIPK